MADQTEEDYRKELEAAGVEIPENDPPVVTEPEAEMPPKEPEEPKVETPEEPKQDEPIVERKRSIYDDLKEKKAQVRSEREAREEIEKELAAVRQQLEDFQRTNSAEREDPSDLLTFAAEKGADPELVQRILEEAKQHQPAIDPEVKARLDQFNQWQKQNAHVVEKQMFDEEFGKTIPSLRKMFPSASDEELSAMKPELDKLSHSKEMHDKELEYVAFKHHEHLASLVSPKIRGMEEKGRNAADENSSEFNPAADLSKMSATQLEAWNKQYENAVSSDRERLTAHGGRKVIL